LLLPTLLTTRGLLFANCLCFVPLVPGGSRGLKAVASETTKPLPKLLPNYKKILEAILYLIRSRGLKAMPSGTTKPLPKLVPNYKKILEAILYLINEADRCGLYVTEFDIDKSMFLADVKHLNEYGRPITFDNYVAMVHGPVPSATRDILQPNFKSEPHYKDAWPPWDREPSPSDGPKAFKFFRPKPKENSRVLSKSDIGALMDALLIVKSLRFGGVKDLTHKHPAYLDAWVENGTSGAYDFNYAKLLDSPDDELLEDLVYSSKHP
jgi:hypothetical protein